VTSWSEQGEERIIQKAASVIGQATAVNGVLMALLERRQSCSLKFSQRNDLRERV
jgi:hypothetical protein